jgi:hypothetical protein
MDGYICPSLCFTSTAGPVFTACIVYTIPLHAKLNFKFTLLQQAILTWRTEGRGVEATLAPQRKSGYSCN